MNILNEIEKDAKQILRERRTLAMLLIAPLLVLFITAAIFGRDTEQGRAVPIGICDMDGSLSSQYFVQAMGNSSKIVLYESGADCASKMTSDVRGGSLAAGIVVGEGFQNGIEKGQAQNITLLVDNSRLQVSQSIEAYVKAAVQETDQKIGAEFIGTVWERLRGADRQLEGMRSDLNDTRKRAAAMKLSLKQSADSLSALDTEKVRGEIGLANETINDATKSLDAAMLNLTKIESDFESYDLTLNQTEADLLSLNETVGNLTSLTSNSTAGLNCSDLLVAPYCASWISMNDSANSVKGALEARIAKVREARKGLAEANVTVQQFKSQIYAARFGTESAKDKTNQMLDFVGELEKNRKEALVMIGNVNSSLDEITGKTYEFESIINMSRSQIGEITAREPNSVISPLLVRTERVFGSRPFFDFMLPSMLPLILMFIALFLSSAAVVREKAAGTLRRISLSQAHPLEFAAVKTASFTVVLLPEALVLAAIASLFYGAFPISDFGTLSAVMVGLGGMALVFVAAGVLIAVFSESESTAFLSSLVVGLPLLFLSGLLFPIEFMPPIMSTIASFSPLTQGVFGMQSALIYHSGVGASIPLLFAYAAALTALSALALSRGRRG